MAGLDYKVEDRSILLPFYKRFLIEPFIPHIPASIHPNVITHVGHVLNLAGTALLWIVGIDAAWACVLAALGLHAYMWCDNADGAHARRTGQTSTYGEFLDHGLDQLNTAYIGCLTAMALDASPVWFVATVLLTSGAAAITYWEQSVTGVFRLGLLNQVESLSVLGLALCTTAIFGRGLWQTEVLAGVTLQVLMLGWMAITIGVGALRAMWRVAQQEGFAAITPIALYVGLSALVLAITQLKLAPWWAALAVAGSLNVFYGMRMLALRLSREQPGVEVIGVVGAVLLSAVALGEQAGVAVPALGALLGFAGALVVLAIRETRRGLSRLAQLLVVGATLAITSSALAQPARCTPVEALVGPERSALAFSALSARAQVFRLSFPDRKDPSLVATDGLACPWSPAGAVMLGALAPIATASAAGEWVRTFEPDTVLERPWPILEAFALEGAPLDVPVALETGVSFAKGLARATVLVETPGELKLVMRSYPTSGRASSDRVLARIRAPRRAVPHLESSAPMPTSKDAVKAREEAKAHLGAVLRVKARLAQARAAVLVGDRERARALNVEGYELHKKRDYVGAARALREAVLVDPSFGQAHYNLACTLARARARGQTCEIDATRPLITRALRETMTYMPGKRSKLLADPDLANVRDTVDWLRIAGRAKDTSSVLRGVTWYGPAPGAFGPMSGLSFKPGGRYTAWVKIVDDVGVRIEKSGGRYSVDGVKVTLRPDARGAGPLDGLLDANGRLVFDDQFGPFTDDPSDCSA